MPIYFFHIRDGDSLILDEEGTEFEYIQAAFAEAEQSARELALEQVKAGNLGNSAVVELTNTKGTVLMVVPLKLFLTRH
jgi:UPF0288 family protein (methanogenesis marker protein 3)